MSINSWADSYRSAQYHQSANEQKSIDLYQEFLQGETKPDVCARKLADIYEPEIKRGAMPVYVTPIWSILCSAVQEFGDNHEMNHRLIDLLFAISELPEVLDDRGRRPLGQRWEDSYWKPLPDFAIVFRDYGVGQLRGMSRVNPSPLICMPGCDPDETGYEDPSEFYAQATPLLNATTFAAMYLNRGATSMSFFASMALTADVARPCVTSEDQRGTKIFVPPAATWILLAGECLYSLCQCNQRQLSLKNWLLWKQGFGELAANEALEEHVRDICRRAAMEMARIEEML